MKVKIKTKDFLKIINPLTEGIIYNNNKIIINLEQLKLFVEHPKQMKVFEDSNNVQEQLLKNIALYIINSNEKKFISVDINTNSIIQNGIFEYIKAIYFKEPYILLSLPKSEDNLLLIKRYHLIDILDDILVTNKNPEKAQDVELGKLSSIFLQTKILSNEENVDKIKITENDRFFWKEETTDLYENPNFLIDKIKAILNTDKYSNLNLNSIEFEFFNLIKKANNDFVFSDQFKLSLLNLNDSFLNTIIINSKQPNLFSIDFSNPVFIKKIEEDIENNKLNLLKALYSKYKKEKTNSLNLPKPSDFNRFINHKNVIEYLTNNSYSNQNNNLSLVSCYPNLDTIYKENNLIISKYISHISHPNLNNNTYISPDDLLVIPLHKFNEPDILSLVLKHLTIIEFKNLLNKNLLTNTLLNNKKFIIQHSIDIPAYKLSEIIDCFFKKEDITKDFLLNLISVKPDFYFHLQQNKLLNAFYEDFDIIIQSVASGSKFKDIPITVMAPHLLIQDTPDKEKFKINFLIEKNLNGKFGKKIFNSTDEINAFNNKFDKLEYSFFNQNQNQNFNYSLSENKSRDKKLTQLKSLSEVNELLNKIDSLKLIYNFNAQSFYNALSPELKNNIELTKRLSKKGKIIYSNLSETLQYNKDIAIHFINLDSKNISLVPKEFFNDINFSLEFSKIMDTGQIDLTKEVPLFINKFFENQKITENFFINLKRYILFNSIKENIPNENNNNITKKNKI